MQVVPNQLVELHLDTGDGRQVFRTRVEDAYDDIVLVGAPLQQGHVVPIRVGTQLQIEFILKGQIQEGRFGNTAIVEKRVRTQVPLLQLRLLGDWEKKQKRDFVRVPVHIDAVVVPKQEDGSELPAQTALILNLSGGGFLLRSAHPFQLEDEVRVSFRVGDEQIVAAAHVARMVLTETGQDYGFAFLDIPEKMRKVIIQFVFKRQIELAALAREDIT